MSVNSVEPIPKFVTYTEAQRLLLDTKCWVLVYALRLIVDSFVTFSADDSFFFSSLSSLSLGLHPNSLQFV